VPSALQGGGDRAMALGQDRSIAGMVISVGRCDCVRGPSGRSACPNLDPPLAQARARSVHRCAQQPSSACRDCACLLELTRIALRSWPTWCDLRRPQCQTPHQPAQCLINLVAFLNQHLRTCLIPAAACCSSVLIVTKRIDGRLNRFARSPRRPRGGGGPGRSLLRRHRPWRRPVDQPHFMAETCGISRPTIMRVAHAWNPTSRPSLGEKRQNLSDAPATYVPTPDASTPCT